MFEAADYKLSDLLGVAGASVGIIIAAGILLQCLSTRYIAALDRYRALTGEYRENHASDTRRGGLRDQIVNYRWQIIYLNAAAVGISLALLCFLLAVGSASLSVIYPRALVFRSLGATGLFFGLLCITAGIALHIRQTLMERGVFGEEVTDFADLPNNVQQQSGHRGQWT